VIKVGPTADGKGSRDVTVVPVGTENGLRNLAWIEDNRRTVDKLAAAGLGYVLHSKHGRAGIRELQPFTSFHKLTNTEPSIDERFNGGGLLADYVVEYLNRQQLAKIAFATAKMESSGRAHLWTER
jgi:tricorn protease